MIAAFVVLLVVALALGGYIVFTVVRDKRNVACDKKEVDGEQTSDSFSVNTDIFADILQGSDEETPDENTERNA